MHFANRTAPDCPETQSGVWARGGVVYSAATDRIYLVTGNAAFSPASHHWGDTVLALNPDGTGNANGDPVDTYTPANFAQLNTLDLDLGSTAPAILPVTDTRKVQNLAVQGGKDQMLRLLNLDNLSGHGGPGFTGGEVGAPIPVPQAGQVLTTPTVWTNPADGSTWVFVVNNIGASALQVVYDASGNPSLSLKWKNTNVGQNGDDRERRALLRQRESRRRVQPDHRRGVVDRRFVDPGPLAEPDRRERRALRGRRRWPPVRVRPLTRASAGVDGDEVVNRRRGAIPSVGRGEPPRDAALGKRTEVARERDARCGRVQDTTRFDAFGIRPVQA